MSKPHGNKDFWVAALRTEGAALRTSAGQVAPDAPVPTCPDWTVADLLRHMSGVYAFVASHVSRGEVTPPQRRSADFPVEGDPLEEFGHRHAQLVNLLESIDPDLPAWNWAPQAKKAVFWHRRMAHETAVHRWDAQVSAGPAEPIEGKLAIDGITEVLDSWLPAGRRSGPVGEVTGVVALHATDVSQVWYVRLRGEGIALLDTDTLLDDAHPHERAQVTGSASDLMLALYGRVPFDVLEVAGDPRLFQALRTG